MTHQPEKELRELMATEIAWPQDAKGLLEMADEWPVSTSDAGDMFSGDVLIKKLGVLLTAALRERDALQLEQDKAIDDAENKIWEDVLRVVGQAWPEPQSYCDSPVELITRVIDERDEFREAKNAAEAHAKALAESELTAALREKDALKEQIEQARVQLAGCSVAALGSTTDVARQGDYGWSAAYQDVVNLRRAHETAVKDAAGLSEQVDVLAEAKEAAEVSLALAQQEIENLKQELPR